MSSRWSYQPPYVPEVIKDASFFTCNSCKKRNTGKYDYYITRYEYPLNKCYHVKCYHVECYPRSYNWIHYRIPSSPAEIRGLNVSFERRRKGKYDKLLKLCETLWPNQVPKEERAKLLLPKKINEMSKKELRIELEKRAIVQHFKGLSWHYSKDEDDIKEKAIKRLTEYLINNEDCKNRYNLLVIGYCKENEDANKINFPPYLKRIVLRYYPPFLF